MRRRRRQRERRSFVLPVSLFLIFVTILCSATYFLKTTVEPNLEDIGKIRSKVIVARMITRAINDQFHEEMDTEDLIIRKTDKNGKTEMIQADTKAMNLLITEIAKELEEQYENVKDDYLPVPLGALLGSKIFSQTGPKVKLKIIPLSVAGMDFKTEFESKGINQTKYKVYIILKSQVKVMAPFVSNTFEVSSTVLIAEAVILGTVPDSFVQVPKEDILDVTNE